MKGADGVVFVADSQRERFEAGKESLRDLYINLTENCEDYEKMPLVFQYNKRDVQSALSLEELERAFNPSGLPSCEAVASQGKGVTETLRIVCKLVARSIQR